MPEIPPPPAIDWATRPWALKPLVTIRPPVRLTFTVPPSPVPPPVAPSRVLPEKMAPEPAAARATPPPPVTDWTTAPIALSAWVMMLAVPDRVTARPLPPPPDWPSCAVAVVLPAEVVAKPAMPPPLPIDWTATPIELRPQVSIEVVPPLSPRVSITASAALVPPLPPPRLAPRVKVGETAPEILPALKVAIPPPPPIDCTTRALALSPPVWISAEVPPPVLTRILPPSPELLDDEPRARVAEAEARVALVMSMMSEMPPPPPIDWAMTAPLPMPEAVMSRVM